MRTVRIGLVQMSMSEHKQKNLEKALAFIEETARQGAHIVCLPELFQHRYFPQHEDLPIEQFAEEIPGPTTEALARAAKRNGITLVGGSLCERTDEGCYNTSIIFDEIGAMIGKYRKTHIPQDPGFYEQSYFKAGNEFSVVSTLYGKIAPLICYDQWFPEAARAVTIAGAQIIVYPTAIGTVDGIEQTEGSWQNAWETVQQGHAIANGVIVAAINRVGKEEKTNFWGGSFVVDQFGKSLVHAGGEEEIVIAEGNLDLGTQVQEDWRFLHNRKPDLYGGLTKK